MKPPMGPFPCLCEQSIVWDRPSLNRLPHAGSRAESPFAGINCSAIPKELFESEGVGYSPGAFPGARKEGSTGKIEVSHQGTLFLEEMGDLSLQAQAKLLRVLEEKRPFRLGSV